MQKLQDQMDCMLIEGKGSHRCRLVTGHFPNEDGGSKEKQTKGAVYGQHRKHFQKIKRDKDPHSAWIADFAKEVRAWIDGGEQVVIKLDANRDV